MKSVVVTFRFRDLCRLSDVQNERDMLNLRLKETIESTMTAEERAFAMEQLLKEEETRIHQVEKELARLREIQVGLITFTTSRLCYNPKSSSSPLALYEFRDESIWKGIMHHKVKLFSQLLIYICH